MSHHDSSAISANGAYPVPAAMVSETKNTISSISNDINKLSYGEGIVDYLTITTDMAMLFAIKGIINEGEAYIPSKSNEIKDKDGEIV